MSEVSTYLAKFFGTISNTTVLGLPLDTTLHVLIGFLVTYIGLKCRFKFLHVFLFLLVLESIKALFAAMTINHDFYHGLKEFFATFIYPAWIWIVRKIKSSQIKR
jgi:hypothetical protein